LTTTIFFFPSSLQLWYLADHGAIATNCSPANGTPHQRSEFGGRLRCSVFFACKLRMGHQLLSPRCGASVRETPPTTDFSNSQLHHRPVVTGSPELPHLTEIWFPATAPGVPLISPALLITSKSTVTVPSPISVTSSPVLFSSQKCSSNAALEQAVTLMNHLPHLIHDPNLTPTTKASTTTTGRTRSTTPSLPATLEPCSAPIQRKTCIPGRTIRRKWATALRA
jgi:hypothetical protein